MTTPGLVRTVILSLAVITLALVGTGVFLALHHAPDSIVCQVFGIAGMPITGMCALLSNNSGHTSTAIGAGAQATTEPAESEEPK
jgi:hypothetical protein